MFNSDGRTSVSSTTSTGVRRNPSVRMGSSCKYLCLLNNFHIRFFRKISSNCMNFFRISQNFMDLIYLFSTFSAWERTDNESDGNESDGKNAILRGIVKHSMWIFAWNCCKIEIAANYVENRPRKVPNGMYFLQMAIIF